MNLFRNLGRPFKGVIGSARGARGDRKYAAILKSASDGFWVVDTEGRLKEVNDAYCRMSGYSRDELLCMRIPDLDATEAPDEIKRHIARVVEAGSDRFEHQHRRKDGSLFDVNISVQRVNLDDGFFVCFLQDITARKKAERALKQANEQLEQNMRMRTAQLEAKEYLLSQSQRIGKIGSWSFDPTTQILTWTDETYRLYGVSPETFTLSVESMLGLIHPDDRRSMQEWIGAAAAGHPPRVLEFRAVWPDGTTHIMTGRGEIIQSCGIPSAVLAGTVQDITEHKRAQEEAQILLGTAIDGYYTVDMEGRLQDTNESYCAMVGYTREELLKMSIAELDMNDTANVVKEKIQQIRALKQVRMETQHRRKDGRIIDIEASCRFLEGKNGRLFVFMRDITERKRAETVLKENVENLRRMATVVSDSNDAIILHDLEGKILAWNHGAKETYGYTEAEALEMNIRNIVAEPDREAALTLIERIKKGGIVKSFELRRVAKNGRILDVWLTTTLLTDDKGNPVALATTERDITARKQNAARISEQAEIIDRSPLVIAISDISGRTTYFSGGASRLLGMKKEDVLGRKPEELFAPETMKRLSYGRDVALATGSWRGEVPFLTLDGRSVVVEFLLAIIKDDAGKPRARISIGTDVTEKKQLEEQALRAQRLDNIGMLAGGIAHDLNNALAPIIMAGPLLHQHVSDPGALRMLAIIEQASARGVALVRQMVSFARGTGTEKQLVQVGHVLREVIDLATSTFPKSIQIESHLPSDLWPVLSDPTKIHQVFVNLCVNARDAMPDGGELTLSAANRTLDAAEAAKISPDARPGDFLTVEVRDTGTGIPPEVLEKIWDPFFTTKREGKGTGLGLSTVRSIVRQHDGFVTLLTFPAGKSPHGTTFTVYLPAAKGEKKSGPSVHPFESQQGNGELILVVDDEKPVCELTSKILTRFGYNVVTAENGVEAIVAFIPRATEVRLLLTDLDMPTLSGPALAAALRRLKPDLPIIAMSGVCSQSDDTHKKFAMSFLAKPFEAETLLSIVRRALDAPPDLKPDSSYGLYPVN